MDTVLWQRKIPLRYQADVAVVGGGMAGLCAAVAAAREGASVILVERFAVTGGNATAGGVANFSGETRGQGRVFDEIISDLEAFGAIAPYPGEYKHFVCMNRVFDHSVLSVTLQEMLSRYDVKLLLHTRFVDVKISGSKIDEIIVSGPSGPEALRADVFIDCSGEAQVAHQAGFTCVKGDPVNGRQLPPSLMFFVREMAEPFDPQLPLGWLAPVKCEKELPMTSVWPDGPQGKALKVKVPLFDTSDTESMTALEKRARQRMLEVLDYYQRVEGKPWRLNYASPVIGIRESRRVVGDYVLSLDDVRAGRTFEDAVARGVFFLDGMDPASEKRTYLLPKEKQVVPPYQIPLRSLIARDGSNLLMAGRCFSADQLALSSARVMPTCAMLGQAAGILAALAARGNCEVRTVDELRVRRLVEQYGANLDV